MSTIWGGALTPTERCFHERKHECSGRQEGQRAGWKSKYLLVPKRERGQCRVIGRICDGRMEQLSIRDGAAQTSGRIGGSKSQLLFIGITGSTRLFNVHNTHRDDKRKFNSNHDGLWFDYLHNGRMTAPTGAII